MSSLNILFYSKKCQGSIQLLSLLQIEKLDQYFHLYCIDDNSAPPQIKVTPTLIIRNIPTPYVAGDAFIWLAKVKQWKTNILMQRMNNEQQKYLQSINNNLVSNESHVLGFSDAEMNGMSDIFSFFSQNMEKECQDPFPQSYCSNESKDNIFTPPLEGGSYKVGSNPKCKISQDKQKLMLHTLETARKQQDDTFKNNIESFRKQYGK